MGYGVPDSGVDFFYVTPEEAYYLHKNDRAIFVDGRDRDDFDMSRIQTSFHLPANELILNHTKIDQGMVKHILELAASGRTLIALSDSCIKGDKNRGHVSRCRHVAQYVVELGADRTRVVRMQGGINAWKARRLDGILGDLRPMFAGAIQPDNFKVPPDEEEGEEEEEEEATHDLEPSASAASASAVPATEEVVVPLPLAVGCQAELGGLKGRADLNGKKAKVLAFFEEAGRWEVEIVDEGKERVRIKPDNLTVVPPKAVVAASSLRKVRVCIGGDTKNEGTEGKEFAEMIKVPPREWRKDTPTAYFVLKGELYKKPSRESDKIIKLERPISSVVRTTGEVYEGANGGKWAELDTSTGEKQGWIYLEGPGFGPSTRKIRTEFLRP